MTSDIRSLEQRAADWATKNRTPLSDAANTCGDGRYTPAQSCGNLRWFGADFGLLAGFQTAIDRARLQVPSSELTERYYEGLKQLRGNGTKLNMHNDEHGKPCGHVGLLMNPDNASMYGVTTERMIELMEAVTQSCVVTTTLHGIHEEKQVLFEDGLPGQLSSWGVNSHDLKTGEQSFVVSIRRGREFVADLTPRLAISHLDHSMVYDILLAQTTVTASFLAANLPQFAVSFSPNGQAHATFLSMVKESSISTP